MRGNHKRSVFKNHRNRSLRTATKGCPFRTFNSYMYSLNFNDRLRNRRTGFCLGQTWRPGCEQFLWFLTNYLVQFHRIFLQFGSSKPFCLKGALRSIKAYLCPNINSNAVDFSERHSKEVISFFWRSVYLASFLDLVYLYYSWIDFYKVSTLLPSLGYVVYMHVIVQTERVTIYKHVFKTLTMAFKI